MATSSIEERLSALEVQMAHLLENAALANQSRDWRRTLGMFTGDDVMRQIDARATEYREEDRRKSLDSFDAGGESR